MNLNHILIIVVQRSFKVTRCKKISNLLWQMCITLGMKSPYVTNLSLIQKSDTFRLQIVNCNIPFKEM